MIVKPYEPGAFDGIVQLWRETGVLVAYNDPAVELPRLQASPNCQIYAGFEGDRVMASILVGHDGYRGWIYKLAVAPDFRKRGYGKQLVALAESWLVARGLPKCNLMVRATNPEALAFYRHLNYVNAGHAVLGRWLEPKDMNFDPAMIDVVVTFLEMTERPTRPTTPIPPGNHALMRVEKPTAAFYRFLYNTVGEPWFWIDRRKLTDEILLPEISDPKVELFVLYAGGQPAGYVELDRRQEPDVGIAYFGLIPDFIGRGLGKYLLNWSVDQAWSYGPRKVTVETCTLDHPRALSEYQRAGFRPCQQIRKKILDPRLEGHIPPHVEPRLPHPSAV